MTKTIATGEGGMVTTENPEWAERINLMCLHGMSRDAWKRSAGKGSSRACQELLRLHSIPAQVFGGDGREIGKWIEPASVDVCLPLGWTDKIPDLERVFESGCEVLRKGGHLIIDVIDQDYQPIDEAER